VFIDARTVPQNTVIETEVCIIGAGAAGITLSREFIDQPFRVCLLESGGLDLEPDTQSLYEGENVGLPYYPLVSARLRYFGGTTNHWDGRCLPLDEIDFAARDWVSNSGWPFDRSHLDPFYARAQRICLLGPLAYACEDWEAICRQRLPFDTARITSTFSQASHDPTSTDTSHGKTKPARFGTLYRDEIGRAHNISTYLYANAVDIEANEVASQVNRVRVATLAGNGFWVSARLFVLATGGIENARLLLLSNGIQKAGLGNQRGLVGRYFMEHHHGPDGIWILSNPEIDLTMYNKKSWENGTWVRGFLGISLETQHREKLLNCGLNIQYEPTLDPKGTQSLKKVLKAIRGGDVPDDFARHVGNIITDIDDIAISAYRRLAGQNPFITFKVRYWGEPLPNPDSRVLLSPERDRLGKNRVWLDWRLSDMDLFTMKRVYQILAEELGRAGLGRLKVPFAENDTSWPSPPTGSFHHMGTTRMHVDPKHGVVDPNCRVHGIANLFVAGSSVFPTAGQANPTLTIVALATRLADHIKGFMT
jgi:choline dehydrogenase-like flavoprotein